MLWPMLCDNKALFSVSYIQFKTTRKTVFCKDCFFADTEYLQEQERPTLIPLIIYGRTESLISTKTWKNTKFDFKLSIYSPPALTKRNRFAYFEILSLYYFSKTFYNFEVILYIQVISMLNINMVSLSATKYYPYYHIC